MKKLLGVVPIGGALAAMALLSVMASAPALAQDTAQAARKDLVLKEDAKCTRCHDEEDSPNLLKIGRTKHGTRADGRTPTCTTCHGESDSHINVPKGAAKRPKPDRYFTKGSHTPPEVQSATCLGCHQGATRMFWANSTHAARDLSCSTCHKIHTDHDKVRDKFTQTEVCFTCHKTQRVDVRKPSRHPILEGKMSCSNCHNPHGSAGPKMMVRENVNDTCYQCHAEKRGPFLWIHPPVAEDCSLCHNPHGTTTASMLKWRVPFLCQQCHEATSHRGNIPTQFTGSGTSGAGITLARGCVNCHTNIHGGNNPQNNAASRTFRR